jgi:hypothetical protein
VPPCATESLSQQKQKLFMQTKSNHTKDTTIIMAEQSLDYQVRTLKAQLDAANARISNLEARFIHPLLAYSGTEMTQAL